MKAIANAPDESRKRADSTGSRLTSTRPAKPQAVAFASKLSAAVRSCSTQIARSHPRERASSAMAPLPA